MEIIVTCDSQRSSEMRYLVRRGNSFQIPLIPHAVHLFGKLVKANLGYRREQIKSGIHQTRRRIGLAGRSGLAEFSSRGQEDGDEALPTDSAQSVPEFGEYVPRPWGHRFNQGVRLIPTYDHIGRSTIAKVLWIQKVDNLFRDLCDSQDCSTSP